MQRIVTASPCCRRRHIDGFIRYLHPVYGQHLKPVADAAAVCRRITNTVLTSVGISTDSLDVMKKVSDRNSSSDVRRIF